MFTRCFFLLQKCFLFLKWVLFFAKNVLFFPWKGAVFKCFFCQSPLRSLFIAKSYQYFATQFQWLTGTPISAQFFHGAGLRNVYDPWKHWISVFLSEPSAIIKGSEQISASIWCDPSCRSSQRESKVRFGTNQYCCQKCWTNAEVSFNLAIYAEGKNKGSN